MKMSNVALALSGVVFGGVLLSSHASAAEGRLVVYCSAQNTMCEQETMAFEKKYGIKTSFIRGGTGTILAKIDAEKDNPQGDVWYGGTLDPHSQAGEWAYLKRISHQISHKFLNSLKIPLKLKATIPPRFISVY